eukprot:SAG31_NODE_39_length_31377_cov_5.971482_6_plen_201_part_00
MASVDVSRVGNAKYKLGHYEEASTDYAEGVEELSAATSGRLEIYCRGDGRIGLTGGGKLLIDLLNNQAACHAGLRNHRQVQYLPSIFFWAKSVLLTVSLRSAHCVARDQLPQQWRLCQVISVTTDALALVPTDLKALLRRAFALEAIERYQPALVCARSILTCAIALLDCDKFASCKRVQMFNHSSTSSAEWLLGCRRIS